ncbi:MAG: hypothetical protein ILO43_02185 [Clostridia bacterium]|nr:hypothetical protein [Clostridia bacterium]
MEIERKWMVDGWPASFENELLEEHDMAQGYVTTKPTVRIRSGKMLQNADPALVGQEAFILCFKSKSRDSGLSRTELEFPIPEERFRELEAFIVLPLIRKVRRTYRLSDGKRLEVSHVDEGLPTEFWYAEVEFDSEEEAVNWSSTDVGLEQYLVNEVTREKGQSMAAYWRATRE